MFYMEQTNFKDWLNAEMAERGWGVRELGRRANIAASLISNIGSGDTPSFDTCVAIADALGKPRMMVVVLAGLLPAPPEFDEEIDSLVHIYRRLDSRDKKVFFKMGETLLEENEQGLGGDSRDAKRGKSGSKENRR